MHPSEEIYCDKSNRLSGKTIVLGITGSIAAVECFHLIRELIRNGAKVIPVMTPAAVKLVAPDAMEFASGVKPVTEMTGSTSNIWGTLPMRIFSWCILRPPIRSPRWPTA